MERKILLDKYGRRLNYLRLSVTDRCNFRCYYCMPEEGVNFAARQDLLSFEEMYFLCQIFRNLGISKVRITGGEPFVRSGIIPFLQKLDGLDGIHEIAITSNGSLSPKYITALTATSIRSINISLDSLNAERFFKITRRDAFDAVYNCILQLLNAGFHIKLNCVVADNKNVDDIIPFVEFTRHRQLSVRFLEEMPFNGSSTFIVPQWNYKRIYSHISEHYPTITALQNEPNSTSENYQIPGYVGAFGIIPSFSRTFCGTCNRLRLSATGELRTCLYGPAAINLRDVLRAGATAEETAAEIIRIVSKREKDGFEAEAKNNLVERTSMSVLGG